MAPIRVARPAVYVDCVLTSPGLGLTCIVKPPQPSRWTPLHVAACLGKMNMLTLLLNGQASVLAVDVVRPVCPCVGVGVCVCRAYL